MNTGHNHIFLEKILRSISQEKKGDCDPWSSLHVVNLIFPIGKPYWKSKILLENRTFPEWKKNLQNGNGSICAFGAYWSVQFAPYTALICKLRPAPAAPAAPQAPLGFGLAGWPDLAHLLPAIFSKKNRKQMALFWPLFDPKNRLH